MTRVLKIMTGKIFLDGKEIMVFNDAWLKVGKDGKEYYEMRTPIFVNEVVDKKVKA